MKKSFLFFFLFISLILKGETLLIKDSVKVHDFGGKLSILTDTAGTYRIQDVINSGLFRDAGMKIPNLGVSNHVFWVRGKISNQTPSSVWLDLSQPVIDDIEFYLTDKNSHIIQHISTGEKAGFNTRKHKHPDYIFEIPPNSEELTFYFRVRTGEQLMFPLFVGAIQPVMDQLFLKDVIVGVFAGIILVMVIYNLFIYFSVRDRSYIYYVFYILLIGLTHLSIQGYAYKFLWPGNPAFALRNIYYLSSLVGIAAISFINQFLHTKENAPRFYKVLNGVNGLFIISLLLAVFGLWNQSFGLMQLSTTLGSLISLSAGIYIFRKGYRPAKFFLIAWSVLLGGAILYLLKDFGVIPYSFFSNYIMLYASAIEIMLLSLALADRINILKKEKEESQQRSIEALRENERIVREQNIILESKVKERTEELEKSNTELSVTLLNLKETQTQLLEAEKMASLGQLTAGIAHEINNPINFVLSNIRPLKRDISDVMEFIRKIDAHDIPEQAKKEIQNLKNAADIGIIEDEIQTLLKGIEEGANRTSEIVKGLKVFSRVDEYDIKRADIKDGIESTLTLLGNQLKGRINIKKEFASIPPIECFPGKLNQVFMNILSNAIHAIDLKNPGQGEIKIKTEEKGENVYIHISDNGKGMNPEVQKRIFEPFYTTKPVGEGTGLGLAIAYNIIEKHQGKIHVISEEDKGSEFIIELPKVQTILT